MLYFEYELLILATQYKAVINEEFYWKMGKVKWEVGYHFPIE
jgi:hypothetical protein